MMGQVQIRSEEVFISRVTLQRQWGSAWDFGTICIILSINICADRLTRAFADRILTQYGYRLRLRPNY